MPSFQFPRLQQLRQVGARSDYKILAAWQQDGLLAAVSLRKILKLAQESCASGLKKQVSRYMR